MLAGGRDPRWHPDYPRRDDRDAASMFRGENEWGPRHITRTFDGLVFGSIGFFGPPTPAAGPSSDEVPEAEIGYGLVSDARGRGVATEAVRALMVLTDAVGVACGPPSRPRTRPASGCSPSAGSPSSAVPTRTATS